MNTQSFDQEVSEPSETLSSLLAAEDRGGIRDFLTWLEPTAAVRALFRLNREQQEKLVGLLSPDQAADLLEDLPDVHAADLIESIDAGKAADIVEALTHDHGADLLGALDTEDADAILAEMAPRMAEEVRKLIAYPPDVAGGLMGTEHFAWPETASVADFLSDIGDRRQMSRQLPQRVILLDSMQRPSGAVEIADLLTASPGANLSGLAHAVDPLTADKPLEQLEDYFDRHETLGAPVVDDEGRLVGRLRRRAVADALAERAQADQLKVQGIVGGEELRTMPVLSRSRRRLSWLSVNIVLNIMAASVIALFQETLAAVIALTVFLPIVSDMSGCSGNQAVAVSMRELTLGIIRPRDFLRVWWREVSVGLLNGIALGLMLAIVAFLWQGSPVLGLVVGLALSLNTIVAVSIGGTVPLMLRAAHVDPAVASGPVLTTVTDICGFFFLLAFATVALPWLT